MDIPDLGALGRNGPTPALVGQAEALLEVCEKIGICCSGCGELIEEAPLPEITEGETEMHLAGPVAYEYLALAPGFHAGEGRPGVQMSKVVICEKECCAEFRRQALEGANARRPFRPWELLPAMEPFRAAMAPKPPAE